MADWRKVSLPRDETATFSKRLTLVFATIFGCLALASCTTGGSSQDLASVLSVADAEKAGETTPQTPEAAKTALVAPDTKKTASAKAAESLAKSKSDAKVAAASSNTNKPKKRTSIFGGNENASLRVNSRTKAQRKPTRTSALLSKRSKTRKRRGKRDPGDLPGVRLKKLFGILGNSEKNHDLDEPVEVASIASRARRGTFGLLLQTKSVQVGCFPRRLVKILKSVERRFRRTPIVTSGYRSAAKNRRIRGARNSAHIRCQAADIQVKGVSKWKLAKYLRSLPGRGGVGTYCHTKSVHIDIGVKRDWNWRCRRRRR